MLGNGLVALQLEGVGLFLSRSHGEWRSYRGARDRKDRRRWWKDAADEGEREREGRRPNSSSERKDVAKRERGRVEERKTEAGVVFWWFLTMCSPCRSVSLSFFSDRNGGLASFQNPRLRTTSLPRLLSPQELSHFSPQLQMSFYTPPAQQRSLRACMVCAVVQLHNV